MSVLRRLQAGHYPTIGQQTRKRPAAAGRTLQRAKLASERILNDTEWPQIVHFRGQCQPCVGRGGLCGQLWPVRRCGGAYRSDVAGSVWGRSGFAALRRIGRNVRKVFSGRKFVRAAGAGIGARSGPYGGGRAAVPVVAPVRRNAPACILYTVQSPCFTVA